MSEIQPNPTLSEVRRQLSVHARTMKELADRAALAIINNDIEAADTYIGAVEEELKKMVALTKANRTLLRQNS